VLIGAALSQTFKPEDFPKQARIYLFQILDHPEADRVIPSVLNTLANTSASIFAVVGSAHLIAITSSDTETELEGNTVSFQRHLRLSSNVWSLDDTSMPGHRRNPSRRYDPLGAQTKELTRNALSYYIPKLEKTSADFVRILASHLGLTVPLELRRSYDMLRDYSEKLRGLVPQLTAELGTAAEKPPLLDVETGFYYYLQHDHLWDILRVAKSLDLHVEAAVRSFSDSPAPSRVRKEYVPHLYIAAQRVVGDLIRRARLETLVQPVIAFGGGFSAKILWDALEHACYVIQEFSYMRDTNRNGELHSSCTPTTRKTCIFEIPIFLQDRIGAFPLLANRVARIVLSERGRPGFPFQKLREYMSEKWRGIYSIDDPVREYEELYSSISDRLLQEKGSVEPREVWRTMKKEWSLGLPPEAFVGSVARLLDAYRLRSIWWFEQGGIVERHAAAEVELASNLLATAIMGPAYVYALARFSFESLTEVWGQGSPSLERMHYPLGLRLAECLSIATAFGLPSGLESDLFKLPESTVRWLEFLVEHARDADIKKYYTRKLEEILGARDPSSIQAQIPGEVMNWIEGIGLRCYSKVDHERTVSEVQPLLERGDTIGDADSVLILNALWNGVVQDSITKQNYVNELSVFFSLLLA
jgi:hypothetical protein